MAAGDVEMAHVAGEDREGEGLLGGKGGPQGMRQPSARSFLDYQDEAASDSGDSFGAWPRCGVAAH